MLDVLAGKKAPPPEPPKKKENDEFDLDSF